MTATLEGELAVMTCIACGARSRAGDCDEGCVDVALDLVDVGVVERMQVYVAALDARVAQLRGLAEALVATHDDGGAQQAGGDAAWAALRERAREVLRRPVGPAPDAEVVEAWGCPACGRIDEPQPCLGVCIRRPVLMADASRYRTVREAAERRERANEALSALARMVAHVRPHAGQERAMREALRARARAALGSAEA